jgi:hypothetical protein
MNDAPARVLDRAADFLWRNARLLERALFARTFLGGPPDAVQSALRAYRNPDGGFGHALEPDVRAPASMPLHCEIALRAMRDAGVRDPELAGGVADFLASVAEPDGRVPIVLPAVLAHPHASHWAAPIFGGDSPNPTAALAGLLLDQGFGHPWLARAVPWCWERLARPLADAHEVAAALVFLEHAPERPRAAALAHAVAGAAEKAAWYLADPAAESYGVTPLHLCPTPDAIARSAFPDALLEAHLDALAARQQPDGGWPIAFEPPGPGAACEWRGRWTLDALGVLRAWHRI